MYQIDVLKFMEAADQLKTEKEDIEQLSQLYMDLVTEEYEETLEAFKQGDVIGIADGLADMVWVIMGLANVLNIPFEDVWGEVRASNMSKCVDGKLIKRDDGKVMKPSTYFPPNIASVLRR